MRQEKHLLLIRMSGDISTKAEMTRSQFTTKLVRNIKDALKSHGIPFEIQRSRIRLYVETPDEAAVPIIARVFGVKAIARAQRVRFETIDDIVAAGLELHKGEVAGKTFAIRPKRSGDRNKIPFKSGQIAIDLGQALLPHSRGVDLGNPDITIQVEVHPERAFFFTQEVPGPGGLPLKSSDRALSLMSGGFDSPVASWLMMARGLNLDYVFFNLGGTAHRRDVLQVLDVLAGRWSYGTRPRLHEIDLRPMIDHLRQTVRERFWQVILKRLMIRGASILARNLGHGGLITGEALAQVSSQTLQNLSVINQATDMLIARPLIGHDKEHIIDLARHIGTHDISAGAQEYCALTPSKPATAMTMAQVEEAEAHLDFARLDEAIQSATRYNLRDLDPEALDLDTPSLDHIPEGATLLDLRDERAFASWHYPEAIHLEYFQALRAFRSLKQGPKYVLYCEVGLKSAGLAEAMRRAGFDAYNFKGGVPRLIKYAADQSDPLLAELLSPV